MKNEELLYKLNNIKKHNEILALKNSLNEKEQKIQNVKKQYKHATNEYDKKVKESIISLNEKIKELEDSNNKLIIENNYYKKSINKIPKFIIKLFIGKEYKQLNKGEINGK